MDDKPVTRKEMLEALAANQAETRQAFTRIEERLSTVVANNKMEEAIGAAKKEPIADFRVFVTKIFYDYKTEILRAFQSHQDSLELRMRTAEAKLSNIETGLSERVAIVERRMCEIEKRLLLNPPAA